MAFKFYAEHDLSRWPEYHSVLHELRDADGNQMMVIHMSVDPLRFSLDVMKRMKREFETLRSCTDVPIFAIEDNPDDDKWGRYVGHMGFEFSSRVECTDGLSRRCFVSKKKNNNEHDQHEVIHERKSAVVSTSSLPSAGIPGSV